MISKINMKIFTMRRSMKKKSDGVANIELKEEKWNFGWNENLNKYTKRWKTKSFSWQNPFRNFISWPSQKSVIHFNFYKLHFLIHRYILQIRYYHYYYYICSVDYSSDQPKLSIKLHQVVDNP